MTDETKILVDNLKETIKVIEKLTMISVTASLVLLILSIVNPSLAGAESPLKVPLVGAEAPPWIVALVALAVYFGTGVFILLYYRSAQRIKGKLQEKSPSILDALMTYPSILALNGQLQLMTIFFIGALGMLPINQISQEKAWFSIPILGSPYILLFIYAFYVEVSSRIKKSTSTH